MDFHRIQQLSGIPLGMSVALYIINHGVLGLINVFQWWIAVKEGVEMIVWLLFGPANIGLVVAQFGTPEVQNSLIGILTLAGTALVAGSYLYHRPEGWFKPVGFSLLFLPPASLAAVYFDLRTNDAA